MIEFSNSAMTYWLLIAVIPALWIAGSLLRKNLPVLEKLGMPGSPLIWLFAWLVMAGLIYQVLVHLAQFLLLPFTVLAFYVEARSMMMANLLEIVVMFGSRFLVILFIYGLALWVWRRKIRPLLPPAADEFSLTGLEKLLLILAPAGILYEFAGNVLWPLVQSLSSLIQRIPAFQNQQYLPLSAVALALVLILLLVLGMYWRIQDNYEAE
jgi:hypothetical protein